MCKRAKTQKFTDELKCLRNLHIIIWSKIKFRYFFVRLFKSTIEHTKSSLILLLYMCINNTQRNRWLICVRNMASLFGAQVSALLIARFGINNYYLQTCIQKKKKKIQTKNCLKPLKCNTFIKRNANKRDGRNTPDINSLNFGWSFSAMRWCWCHFRRLFFFRCS